MYSTANTFISSVVTLSYFYRLIFQQTQSIKYLQWIQLGWLSFDLVVTIVIINAATQVTYEVNIFIFNSLYQTEYSDEKIYKYINYRGKLCLVLFMK